MTFVPEWYEANFFSNIYYSGPAGYYLRKMHIFLEHERFGHYSLTLEVGATHGQHLPFVSHSYDHYILSDLVISDELKKCASSNNKTSLLAADVRDLKGINSGTCDRILMTCLLHHVQETSSVIEELLRCVKPRSGIIDILLPREPSFLWNLGRVLLVFPRVKLMGKSWKDYWKYVKLEHITTHKKIVEVIHAKASILNYEFHKVHLRVGLGRIGPKVFDRITLVKN